MNEESKHEAAAAAGIDPEEWRKAGEQGKREKALEGFNREGWVRLRKAVSNLPLSEGLHDKIRQAAETDGPLIGRSTKEAYLDLQKEAGEIMADSYLKSNLVIPKEARVKDKQLLPEEQWRPNALNLLPDKGEAIKKREAEAKELAMELIRLAQQLTPQKPFGTKSLINFAQTLFEGELDSEFVNIVDSLLKDYDDEGRREILRLFGKIQGLYYRFPEGLKDKNQDWAKYWTAAGYKWDYDGTSCERKLKPGENPDRTWERVY